MTMKKVVKSSLTTSELVKAYKIDFHPSNITKNYIKPFEDELVSLGIVKVERKVKRKRYVVLDAERFFKFFEEKGIEFPRREKEDEIVEEVVVG